MYFDPAIPTDVDAFGRATGLPALDAWPPTRAFDFMGMAPPAAGQLANRLALRIGRLLTRLTSFLVFNDQSPRVFR